MLLKVICYKQSIDERSIDPSFCTGGISKMHWGVVPKEGPSGDGVLILVFSFDNQLEMIESTQFIE